MSNKDRVFVCLYFRQGITNNATLRAQFQHATYHWALFISPKGSTRGDSYDVKCTEAYANQPGSGGWRYLYGPGDLDRSRSVLGQIMIGKLPTNIDHNNVDQKLQQIPLPVENSVPEQNCVTWLADAIQALQQSGCAEQFDIGTFLDFALQRGDDWYAKNQNLTGSTVKENYTQRKFP